MNDFLPIQRQQLNQMIEAPVSRERRVSPAEVAAEYAQCHEVASQLKIIQDLLREAGHLGLSQEFLASIKRDFLRAGAEMGVMQAILTEKENRDTRKREGKVFQKHMERMSPQALTTTPEVNPPANSQINKMPFQSAFAYILLDKYIPEQEEALYALGRDLNFSGFAQSVLSSVLDEIKTFNSAPIVYNLGSYFAQTKDTCNFASTYEMAVSRYEAEQIQVRDDLASARKAQALLAEIKTKVTKNASLQSAQQTKLNGIIDTYNTELATIITQLGELQTALNNMTITKSTGDAQYQSAYTVQKGGQAISVVELQTLENKVVDGAVDVNTGIAQGGLLNFFNGFLADVQDYGDLAQTNQLMLELQIRAMQQEWSIVSGSLKLLHNTYRTLINGFK